MLQIKLNLAFKCKSKLSPYIFYFLFREKNHHFETSYSDVLLLNSIIILVYV